MENKELGSSDCTQSSDESDEAFYEAATAGYIPLGQDASESGTEEENVSVFETCKRSRPLPATQSDESDEEETYVEEEKKVRPLEARKEEVSCSMSNAEANLIKSAMTGFVLPKSVTPEWAKVIPEDIWTCQLKEGLFQMKRPPDAGKES
eukprot:m.5926 g.5926  ORF g.5926 m.5926 type:complete len:150 (+) comp14480_c0_seq1:39-488(+)